MYFYTDANDFKMIPNDWGLRFSCAEPGSNCTSSVYLESPQSLYKYMHGAFYAACAAIDELSGCNIVVTKSDQSYVTRRRGIMLPGTCMAPCFVRKSGGGGGSRSHYRPRARAGPPPASTPRTRTRPVSKATSPRGEPRGIMRL